MNRIAVTTIITVLAVSFLALCLVPGFATAAGIGVAPSGLEISDALRGGQSERMITIFNPDDETTSYTLATAGDAGGWIFFYEENDTSSSIDHVTIPGHENAKILVKFAVPADASNGEHNATIIVSSAPGEQGDTGRQMAVSIAATVAVSIAVTGTQVLSGTVNDISGADVEVDYPLRIKVGFKNTGNVAATPQISVVITNGGASVHQFVSAPAQIKPGGYDTILVEWDTHGREVGDYEAQVTISLDGKTIASQQLGFAILPTGTLTRSGSFTKLEVRGTPALGVFIIIEATFVNTGQIDTRADFAGEVYCDDMLINTLESDEILVQVGNTDTLQSYLKLDSQGKYEIRGHINYEGKKTETRDISFELGEARGSSWFDSHLFLGGIAGFVVVVAGGTLVLRRRAHHR